MVPQLEHAITVHNLTVAFGGATGLRAVSLHVPVHCLTAVVGPSGSGKTTLLKALSCELPWGAGEVWIDQVPARAWPAKKLAFCRVQCATEGCAGCDRSAYEAAACGREPQWRDAFDSLLDLLDIRHLAVRRCGSMTPRDSRRIALANTLAGFETASADGGHLWLDDPLDGLDTLRQFRLLDWLRRRSRRLRSTMISLADPSLAQLHADHAILLREGELVAQGPPESALSADNLTRAFRG